MWILHSVLRDPVSPPLYTLSCITPAPSEALRGTRAEEKKGPRCRPKSESVGLQRGRGAGAACSQHTRALRRSAYAPLRARLRTQSERKRRARACVAPTRQLICASQRLMRERESQVTHTHARARGQRNEKKRESRDDTPQTHRRSKPREQRTGREVKRRARVKPTSWKEEGGRGKKRLANGVSTHTHVHAQTRA